MSWLDTLLDRGNEAKRLAEPIAPPTVKPARQPKPEIKTVWVQTRPARDGDAGGCEAGFYFVIDGVVRMCSESGKPTDKQCRLGPSDDAHRIAGRLTLQAWSKAAGERDFNRPLNYSPSGVA
jgi:hypothetical protein